MQDKVLKMALIGVGNMGKKYAQMMYRVKFCI